MSIIQSTLRKGDLKYALKYIPLKAEALHDF